VHGNDFLTCNQAKKFLKNLDVGAHVFDQIALWFTWSESLVVSTSALNQWVNAHYIVYIIYLCDLDLWLFELGGATCVITPVPNLKWIRLSVSELRRLRFSI